LQPATPAPAQPVAQIPTKQTDTPVPPPPQPAVTQSPAEQIQPPAAAAEEWPPLSISLPEPNPGTFMTWVDGSQLVYVPSGPFVMGDADSKVVDDSDPQHKVNLSGFWIYRREVSNRLYARCVAAGLCTAPAREPKTPYWYADPAYLDDPVVGVNWDQSASYCKYVNARLPSEAEWEKTGRSDDARAYPWGDASPECSLLNFNACLKPESKPDIAGSYPKGESHYRAQDMAGNVMEWVNDWYGKDYYAASPAENPSGPEKGDYKVLRGSAYDTTPPYINLALRYYLKREEHKADLGFRCVPIGEAPQPAPSCSTASCTQGQSCQPAQPAPQGKLMNLSCYFTPNGGKASLLTFASTSPIGDPPPYSVSVNGLAFTCRVLAGYPNRLYCDGGALTPNTLVTVQICGSSASNQTAGNCEQPLTCPPGYRFSEEQKVCVYSFFAALVPAGCPEGYERSGYGCLPIPSSANESCACPAGFYFSAEQKQCLPAMNRPACPLSYVISPLTRRCEPNRTCLPGDKYNDAQGCCESGSSGSTACPAGMVFNEQLKRCSSPASPVTGNCLTINSSILGCPTATVPAPVDSCHDYDGDAAQCKRHTECSYDFTTKLCNHK
jgi:formylglycine-generating enzyme required for sulfatase activity